MDGFMKPCVPHKEAICISVEGAAWNPDINLLQEGMKFRHR